MKVVLTLDISEKKNNLSDTMRYRPDESPKVNINIKTIINHFIGYNKRFDHYLKELEPRNDIRTQKTEVSECLDFVI